MMIGGLICFALSFILLLTTIHVVYKNKTISMTKGCPKPIFDMCIIMGIVLSVLIFILALLLMVGENL